MDTSTSLTPADLEALLQPGRGPRVSIYLPASPMPTQSAEDALRLKNLLREAEAGLEAEGLKRQEIDFLLADATALLDDRAFWRSGGTGVALFASMQGSKAFRLTLPIEQIVFVGETFHIKPLLPLLSGNGHFSLIALSQSRLRLLQGDRWGLRDVTPPKVPTSLSEAHQFDVFEKQSQMHTAGPARGAGANRASKFHGHGATERDDKGRVLEFFHQVDSGVRERLHRHRGPLLLAGVDYLRALYRDANSYPHLLRDGLAGNPDELDAAELHVRAMDILSAHFDRHRDELAERTAERLGTGLAASDLREVLNAAREGRIDTLFVAADRHAWGRFDATSGAVELSEGGRPGDVDLFDRATADTLLRRGRVYAVPKDNVPGVTGAAALMRY